MVASGGDSLYGPGGNGSRRKRNFFRAKSLSSRSPPPWLKPVPSQVLSRGPKDAAPLTKSQGLPPQDQA